MKHRFLITITDTRGFRQFTLHQIVRWVVAAVVAGLVIVGGGTWLYLRELEEAYRTLRQQNSALEAARESLEERIEKRRQDLARLGERLSDLEILVGERPDDNLTTAQRVANVTLSASQLALLFSIVPNGKPLPYQGITSSFGWRKHPIRKRREFHPGLDLRAKRHKPVWTTADGVVEFAGYHKRSGYGNLVIVDHGFGFKTYYGHLHRVLVHKGDTVVKGDLIGLSGNTGLSTAPHLHYEIRFLGRPLNPKWFIRWKKSDYTSIFKKVRQVPWQSFIALVSHLAMQTLPPSSLREPGSRETSSAAEASMSTAK